MTRHAVLFALLLLAGPALAQETVTVEDTEVSYPVTLQLELGGAKHEMRLTGVGLREKIWFNVYAIASYVEASAQVSTAKQLAEADTVKLLHLVMERDVDAPDVAEAFAEAIEANHPQAETEFKKEMQAFNDYFGEGELTTGQHIRFIHVPGKGIQIQVGKRDPLLIEGLPFAKAVWEIYFGENPVTDDLKTGLSSRLK